MYSGLRFDVLRGAALVGILALAVPLQAFAQQGVIRGTVRDADSGDPIFLATVQIVGTAAGFVTDEDGRFTIRAQPGTYTVRASMLGYASAQQRVTLGAGDAITLDFDLSVSALAIDEIIAVGTRTTRTRLESPVAVDVITAAEIALVGELELNQILRTLAPSYNASHQTISDGTDHVNPASLRGLGPDQTLVLINGKRRHHSSLVNVNGTFGRGTVGTDLNAIPAAAIERIEILRDGASAQYGSDAIAGVINIVLKEQYQQVQINGTAGFNPGTDVGGRSADADGEMIKANANFGFRVGQRGFFNVTGSYLSRNRTNRSGIYTGAIFTSDGTGDDAELAARGLTREDFSMKIGQSDATVGALWFNSVFPIAETGEFYVSGGLTNRNGLATGFFRLPHQEARVVPEIFPNGFLPEIRTAIDDNSITAGLRGNKNNWDVDLSVTTGYNQLKFNITNSNNASQGPASPTDFDAGGYRFDQTTGNVDAVKLLDTGGKLEALSVVLGSEYRFQRFQEFQGEPASFLLGNGGDEAGVDFDTTSSGQPKDCCSQVFPGRNPEVEVNRTRNSIGVYAGLESEITDRISLDGTVRFEDYSDFGTQWTGKVAGRVEFIDNYAFRAAVSNGFRAPSLNQVWFSDVSIQFITVAGALEPARVLTANNLSGVAGAFGVPRLDAETSLNISGGFTARPVPNVSITVDGYYVTIDDRVVLSSRFESGTSEFGQIVETILEPFADQGVGQAQFFMNAVDTETKGIDIVAVWGTQAGPGDVNISTAWNFQDTEVTATNVPQSMKDRFPGVSDAELQHVIFNREERSRQEVALPTEKGVTQLRYNLSRWVFTTRWNYFGSVLYRVDCGNLDPKVSCPDNDEDFGAKNLFDLEAGFEFARGATFLLGATNIFNTFPDQHEEDVAGCTVCGANRSSERFPFSRRVTQFGTNGGYYYATVRLGL